MAELDGIDESASIGDDSVPTTSTVESDEEGKEYEVECILAEWTEKNQETAYLTKWTGYPELRCTWQLMNTFNDIEEGGGDVFKEWNEKKMRVSRGYEQAFDIDAWEDREKEEKEKTKLRRQRRARKKARLNRDANLLPSDSEDEGENTSQQYFTKPVAPISSNSSPEDDDIGSLPQETAEFRDPEALWSDEEQQVFIRALQDAGGPYWNDIFAWYGHRGSINSLLKAKSRKDMQTRLDTLRKEFINAGREPPDYMNPPKSKQVGRDRARLKGKSRRKNKAERAKENDSDNSGTSADSILAEIKKKATIKGALKTRPPGGARKENFPRISGLSQFTGDDDAVRFSRLKALKKESSPPVQRSNLLKSEPEVAVYRLEAPEGASSLNSKPFSGAKNSLDKETSRTESMKEPSVLVEPKKKPYSGTARATTLKTSKGAAPMTNRSRVGVAESGPARLAASRPRNHSVGSRPKSSGGGVDVTANWNTLTQPKVRKASTLTTTNAVASSNKPVKLFNSLRVRNIVYKGRKKERAPNLADTVLMDPKTRKPAKTLSANPQAVSAKTPFQEIQPESPSKKSGEGYDKEDLAFVDNSALNADLGDDDQVACVPRLAHPSPDITDSASRIPSSLSPPQPVPGLSGTSRHPPKAPAALRAAAEPSAPAPVSPYITEPNLVMPPTPMVNVNSSAVITYPQTLLATGASTLTLIGVPTQQEKRELWSKIDTDVVYGHIKIGSDLEDLGKTKIIGGGWNVKKLLLANKNRFDPQDMGLNFKNTCTVAEYQRYMHNEMTDYIGSGYLAPYYESQEKYDSIVYLLACHTSLGILFASHFTMVIWPAQTSIWGFLEQSLPPVPPGTTLRYAVYESMPQRLADKVEPLMTTRLQIEDIQRYEGVKAEVDNTPVQPGESHTNVVFRDLFGIEFERLIASNGPQKVVPTRNFYLCFYPANCEDYEPDEVKRQALRKNVAKEHELYIEYLRANGADMIYSMQDIGSHEITKSCSWDYFLNNVKSGAIIIHDCCGRLDQLRGLGKLLRYQSAINVWKTSLSPMDVENEEHSHLVRLFPHGGVICLSVSLILYRPHETLRILRWFRLSHLPSRASGTWKIAVRPRIRKWLLDLIDLCSDNAGQSSFGFSIQVYVDIYTEIWILLERVDEPFGLMVEFWDPEIPVREALVISPPDLPRIRKEWTGEDGEIDHEAIRWNDEEIIQWFSEWAGLHLHEHRKFHVVLGYPKGHEIGDYVTKCYEKGYGYLEHGPQNPGRQELGLFVRSSDSAVIKSAWERNFLEIISYEKCFLLHKVTDQAKLDDIEAARRQRIKLDVTRNLAEAEKERKEARQAAKEALEKVMQLCRDQGGTMEQARAVGRRRLLWKRDEEGTATDKEVEECAIDMDLVLGNQYGWHHKIIAGTPEERAQAKEEQDKELRRLADKVRLSGTVERERAWEQEIGMWAARDEERIEQGGDYEMVDANDVELKKEVLARTVYSKVSVLEPELVEKITGMLIRLDASKLAAFLEDEQSFLAKVEEAKNLFLEYMVTDSAKQSGDAQEWAQAVEAYYTAKARRARKQNGEARAPSNVSYDEEDGELRGGNRQKRPREEDDSDGVAKERGREDGRLSPVDVMGL